MKICHSVTSRLSWVKFSTRAPVSTNDRGRPACPVGLSCAAVADDVAIGIDNAGNVVTEKGLVWSPAGTTDRLAGSPDLQIQLFQGGYALGTAFGDYTGLHKWDTTEKLVDRHEAKDRPVRVVPEDGELAGQRKPPDGQTAAGRRRLKGGLPGTSRRRPRGSPASPACLSTRSRSW